MRGRARRLILLAIALSFAGPAVRSAEAAVVARCELTGTVNAGSAAYLTSCVRRAEERGANALLVRINTPGGSLEATRQIATAFLGAQVPVVAWVGPAGAHAGSAGMFLVLASHVAAMAPGTNIGAAHPIAGPAGADPEDVGGEELARKVENDAAAFAEALARQRGRNAEFAEEAVRESESAPAERAVEIDVVDLLAPSEEALLSQVHGTPVEVGGRTVRLDTDDAVVEQLSPTWGQRLVHELSHPAIAYVLFLVGALGIAIELSHPGGFLAGLLGVACLVLALIGFAALPIRTGAVVLLGFGVALIVAEIFAGQGALAATGVVLLVLGGVLLVDRFDPRWFIESAPRVPLVLILPTALAVGAAAAYVVMRAAQARRLPQQAGADGLLGERGETLTEVGPSGGEVFVHGERWRAISGGRVPAGVPVVIRHVEGLTLTIEETKDVGRDHDRRAADSARGAVSPVPLGDPDRQRV